MPALLGLFRGGSSSAPRWLPYLLGLALGLALFTAPSGARAQGAPDSAAVEKVTKANKRAVEEYQNLNFEEARKILSDALDACAKAGLDTHPVTARTHVHMGVVMLAGFKQKDQATKEFKKALEIQADIKLDAALATPEIQEVFDGAAQAQKTESASAAPEEETTPPPPPPPREPVAHDPITRAAQGSSIPIEVTIDSSVGARKVVLSFSADGSDDFGERELKEASPGNWTGEIPSSATQGAKVGYYIEVVGAGDQVVASKGSAAEPMVVNLFGPDGAALAGPAKKKGPAAAPAEEAESTGKSFYLALGLGSGFGWATGNGETNPADKISPAGFAPAQLGHLAPELGYFVSPQLLISLQLRLQFVTGGTELDSPMCGSGMVCSPKKLAVAGFGRAAWLFGDGDLHPFLGGVAGLGVIRHVTSFAAQPTCGSNKSTTCVDSVEAGPVFVGGTAGILYNLSSSVALTLGTNVVAGFSHFTINVDLNAGLAFEL